MKPAAEEDWWAACCAAREGKAGGSAGSAQGPGSPADLHHGVQAGSVSGQGEQRGGCRTAGQVRGHCPQLVVGRVQQSGAWRCGGGGRPEADAVLLLPLTVVVCVSMAERAWPCGCSRGGWRLHWLSRRPAEAEGSRGRGTSGL
ncbi:hypothetical protein HaLaN_24455 [Haematococcus lacustris]|uniref:Uncharacterized protein n=1 Tax=Haematococcus lacustris TaxID=44745 RepID=A0A699ZUF7_HAELA|nr:hypothetical protein HaLaN_24455 [Haematococcus lacustris]